MAGNMRKNMLARELATAERAKGIWPNALARRFPSIHLPLVYVLGGLLFAATTMVPLAWGIYPLPYYLGYIADHDIESRVKFTWRDLEEEERRISAIRSDYANRYNQVPEAEWINQVSGPLWHLMDRAMRAKNAEELKAYADKEKVGINAKQAAVLVKELQAKKEWIKPFAHIVAPMQDVLSERIYRRGLLARERYLAERNRNIQIITTMGELRRVMVSAGEGGPLIPSRVRPVLDKGFSNNLDRMSLEFRTVLRDILVTRMRPSLLFDEVESKAELAKRIKYIRNQIQEVHEGDRLLARGSKVTPAILRKLRAEEEVFRNRLGWGHLAQRLISKAILIIVIVTGFLICLCMIEQPGSRRDLNAIGLGLLLAMLIAPAYALIGFGLPETMLPVGFFAGIISLTMGRRPAILSVTATSLLLMVILEGRPGVIAGHLASGWLFASIVPGIRYRLGLLSSAALCGIVAGLVVTAWGVARGESLAAGMLAGGAGTEGWITSDLLRYLMFRSPSAFFTWIISGMLLLLLLPFAERIFRSTTNVTLQEQSDKEHPCLKQLVVQAPGTYHHSVIVGTLAEAAAEAVGANPLLARVGSMYHDIGKLMKPEYFTENESGVSRHDSLNPAMSTLIIIAHVKDGAEMAREYRMPEAIIDIIEQHHGQGMVSFFYDRARKQAPKETAVQQEAFRYPGPIPQFPEAALVMLADSVEAASRAMENPTPAHISKQVRNIIMQRLLDHQLDASGLTLTDLGRVEAAFVRILTSMFHSRVKYPDQKEPGVKKNGK